jgi:lysozyme
MKTSSQGIDLIKSFEEFMPTAYQDVGGVWTIGYGFTEGVKEGDTITQEEADARLAQELEEVENYVTSVCKVTPTQNQFDAMVSLAYNIGIGNFKVSSVLADHNKSDFKDACKAFMLWNVVKGNVVVGLTKRRYEESQLYSKEA